MKKTGVCPKCKSQEIGYLENVIHRTDTFVGSQAVIGHSNAPLGIERSQSGGLIKLIKEGPVGALEAYICTACGFYELYIKNPSDINYDGIVGYRRVGSS